jgi:hypothetical protein
MYGGKIKGEEKRDPTLYVNLTAEEPVEIEDGSWREETPYYLSFVSCQCFGRFLGNFDHFERLEENA